mgnify:CR=1 FL=1
MTFQIKLQTLTALLLFGAIPFASAQDATAEDPAEEPEVTESSDDAEDNAEAQEEEVATDDEAGDSEETDIEESDEASTDTAEEAPEEEQPELTWQERLVPNVANAEPEVRPEVILGEPVASDDVDGKRRIFLPYPPRAASPLPPGWMLRPSEELPPITRSMVLADGKRMILEFPAMELQPDTTKSDGTVAMQEPGFDPRRATQTNTISKTLDTFIGDTKKSRTALGEALRDMEQILLSAPAAPTRPAPSSTPADGSPSSPLLPPSPQR